MLGTRLGDRPKNDDCRDRTGDRVEDEDRDDGMVGEEAAEDRAGQPSEVGRDAPGAEALRPLLLGQHVGHQRLLRRTAEVRHEAGEHDHGVEHGHQRHERKRQRRGGVADHSGDREQREQRAELGHADAEPGGDVEREEDGHRASPDDVDVAGEDQRPETAGKLTKDGTGLLEQHAAPFE